MSAPSEPAPTKAELRADLLVVVALAAVLIGSLGGVLIELFFS